MPTSIPEDVRKLKLRVLSDVEATALERSEAIAQVAGLSAELGLDTVLGRVGITRDCAAHCAWCCEIPPEILSVEAQALVSLILTREEIAADVLPALHEAFESYLAHWESHGMGSMPTTVTCPFLDREEQTCRIYEQRPIGCRMAVSQDRKRCEESLGRQENAAWIHRELIEAATATMQTEGGMSEFLRRQGEAGKSPLVVALALLLWPEAKTMISAASLKAQGFVL